MSNPQTSSLKRGLAFIRESLRDNDEDYTRGPLGRALGLLAIPMMLEMSMEAVFAVVDIAFVSRLGTDAVAAVGITEALVTVLYAIAIGLGMGVTAMVSRRIGAGDAESAAQVTGQAIWLCALMSVVVGVIGVIYAEDMLRMMGASPSVISTGTGFTTVLLGGSFSILYLFLLNAAFRWCGRRGHRPALALARQRHQHRARPLPHIRSRAFPRNGRDRCRGGDHDRARHWRRLSTLLPGWRTRPPGIPPAALAARALDDAADDRDLRIGGVGQFLIATASWIVIMRIVALYGSAAIAAYTIALRLIEFVFLPAWGLGNAAATLVGQNLGASQPDRAERSAWLAAKYNTVFMSILGLSSVLAAPWITAWFSTDPDVMRYGTNCIRILGIGYPMYAVGMIMVQALNGAGDTATPSVLNLLCFWILQIPLAWWLADSLAFGPDGVFWAIVISESLLSVLSVLMFRRGTWKHHAA